LNSDLILINAARGRDEGFSNGVSLELCFVILDAGNRRRSLMAKKVRRREWTKKDLAELKKCSRAKLSVVKISKAMKRTPGALRQQAHKLGLRLGHRR
jgi:hypothetical protein